MRSSYAVRLLLGPAHSATARWLRVASLGVVAALAVAVALAGGGALAAYAAKSATSATSRRHTISWLTAGFNAKRTDYNPSETTIGPKNANRLRKLWSVNLGGAMIAQPVEASGVTVKGVSRNIVYEGTERGGFFAIRADTGKVVWHKDLGSYKTACHDMPGGVFGVGSGAAISFTSKHSGVVYVAGGDGAVHALDLATGAEEPAWPVQGVFHPRHETVWGGLNLFDGRVYVTVASHCDDTPYHGSVTEISVSGHRILHRFYPAGPPSGGISGGGVWGWAGVSIDPANRDVFAATGNAFATPENYHFSNSVVELYQSLGVRSFVRPKLSGTDVDFGSTPVMFRPAGCSTNLVAAENKTGALFILSEGKLGSRHRQRLQVANVKSQGFKGEPAWDPVTNMLYLADTSDSSDGPYKHGLVALKGNRNCSVKLAWQRQVGPTSTYALPPPAVANGVVYLGDGIAQKAFAFDAATGRTLWRSPKLSDSIWAPPTIVNGELFVPVRNGYLHAFALKRAVH